MGNFYERYGRIMSIKMARDIHLTGTAFVSNDVQIAREALDATTSGHPDRALHLNILAYHLGERYAQIGAIADFEEARNHAQESVKMTTCNDPSRARYLSILAVILFYGYEICRNINDLEEAIRLTQESLDLTWYEPWEHAKSLNHLARCLYRRFEIDHSIQDIDEAIRLTRAAIDKHPTEDQHVLRYHCNLAEILSHRYFLTKETKFLSEALAAGHRTIEGGPHGHFDYASQLRRLGQLYLERYRREGKTQDIDLAAQILQDALEQTQPNHPDHTSGEYYLGLVFLYRFRQTGRSDDLEAALYKSSLALNLTPSDHAEKPARAASLGAVYHEKFHRSGEIQELETAIQLYQTSVKTCPKSCMEKAEYLHCLGKGHMDWYKSQKMISNLEIAIRLVEEAASLTLRGDPAYSYRLETIGHLYKEKFLTTGNELDLDTAFEMHRKAAESTPMDHPARAHRLRLLALEHRNRYEEKGIVHDLDKTIQLFQDALQSSSSTVRDRLTAGKDLVTILAKAHAWKRANRAARAVSDLMPSLTPFSLNNKDKRLLLSESAGFASDAAAIALNADQSPFEVVQSLEYGRAVIAGSLTGLDCDLWSLNQSYPELAAQYTGLRMSVDRRASSASTRRPSLSSYRRPSQWLTTKETRATKSYGAGQDLENVISEIRNLPGFQDFQRPLDMLATKEAATCGPIVVINVSGYRCDAIMIQEHLIQVMPLLSLKKTDIEEKVRARELGSTTTLQWLWYKVVGPVLDTLGLKNISLSAAQWPHMWWMPTGPLCQFPLHAAGVYANGQSTMRAAESALDRVISSYTSSIRSMIRYRANKVSQSLESKKVLLVAMENTLGMPRLPNAKLEIAQIRKVCESMELDVFPASSLKEQVMSDLMESCKIFHFAGHGHADLSDAFDSHLCIGDADEMERLTVEDLWKLNLGARPPLLAYLSACSTGRIQDERSVEERLDLINAFQVAGFRHVIGTLWEVEDEECVDIARMTYEHMRDRKLTDASVYQGLHKAVREMRDRWLRDLATPKEQSQRDAKLDSSDEETEGQTKSPTWVTYIHYGP